MRRLLHPAAPPRLLTSHGGPRRRIRHTTPAEEEPPFVQGFAFTACQFLAPDEHGAQQHEKALQLSAHGQVLYLPEPGAPCGERFELRLDVDDALVLPATSRHGHDVHLWTHTPGFQGRTEVWLHGMHFDPGQRGTQGGEG
ncbi:hypothetical protein ACFW9I_32565 [[Kitasatospora] papulosa]|uniref:hypothetical protein n=1 Tax=[Kitasatospora] papulosa TaxID=1464011 RepID=UPI0036A0FB38